MSAKRNKSHAIIGVRGAASAERMRMRRELATATRPHANRHREQAKGRGKGGRNVRRAVRREMAAH